MSAPFPILASPSSFSSLQGIVKEYYFDTSSPGRPRCDQLFCPQYSLGVAPDPLLEAANSTDFFMAVGLDSGEARGSTRIRRTHTPHAASIRALQRIQSARVPSRLHLGSWAAPPFQRPAQPGPTPLQASRPRPSSAPPWTWWLCWTCRAPWVSAGGGGQRRAWRSARHAGTRPEAAAHSQSAMPAQALAGPWPAKAHTRAV